MAQQQSIFLRVELDDNAVAQKLGEVSASLYNLKEEQKEVAAEQKKLAAEMRNTNEVTDEQKAAMTENAKKLADLDANIKATTATQKALQGELQAVTNYTTEQGDSFRELDAKARQLENTYKGLSKTERESAAGQELKKKLIAAKEELKSMDAELGNNQRNVGNYAGSILDAMSKMGGLGKATSGVINPIKNATAGLKAMSATPVLAILQVLILVFQKLSERFRGNAAAMEGLTKTFSLFEGVGTIVNKLIDTLANGVVWLADKLSALAEKMGLVSNEMKESQQIALQEIEIKNKQIALTKDAADGELEVAKLRSEAAKTDKYSAQERLDMLQQAADKENELAERRKEIARMEYENIKQKNAQSNSSQEDLQKEADAYAKMVNAEKDYVQGTIRLQSQMASARKQIADEDKARRVAQLAAIKESEQKEAEILQQYQDFIAANIADKYEREYQQRRLAGERELAQLQKRLDTEKNLTAEAKANLAMLITEKELKLANDLQAIQQKRIDDIKAQNEKELQAAKDLAEKQRLVRVEAGLEDDYSNEDKELLKLQENYAAQLLTTEEYEAAIAAVKAKYAEQAELAQVAAAERARDAQVAAAEQMSGALSQAFNALSDLVGEYSEENENAAKASKAFAMVGILAQQAQAIANTVKAITAAIAGATEAGAATGIAAPFTTPAFIAEMVGITSAAAASAITGIVQAKKVLSQAKFADGGIVTGNSYYGDKIIAGLNSGEMVLNKQQQTRLFEIANTQTSRNDFETQVAAFSQALQEMPAPVMVYSEYEDFKSNKIIYNELSAL